ncbi:MAG: sigma-54-dependent transcriptional regulator [Fimbriimonadaceae bacterium]
MKEKKRVLIVDDELNIRRILQAAFDRYGWHSMAAEGPGQALELLTSGSVDCVLTDVTMPDGSGHDLRREIAERWPETPVIVMTAYGSIPDAVQAVREGAFEYVPKPFDLEALKKVIEAAMASGTEAKPSKRKCRGGPGRAVIAESPRMKSLLDEVSQIADSRATVLVTGESGTGKEVIARRIHELSPRAGGPFVAVSCAALPETLLESELFGYEKGAFTGAAGAKTGRFEQADGGTLFLDEIGEIPLPIQVKLLRVLQEREFERLGATRPTRVDVRLVTATNRDLHVAVDEGTFRLDLLYRLQVVEVNLPPLRERLEDVAPLAMHFLERANAANGRTVRQVSDKALEALRSYSWPGNVRELENAIERAVVLAGREAETLELGHLPASLRPAA